MFFKEEYKPFLTSRKKNRPFLPALYLCELTALPINYPSGQGREVMRVLGTFFLFGSLASLSLLPHTEPSHPPITIISILLPFSPPLSFEPTLPLAGVYWYQAAHARKIDAEDGADERGQGLVQVRWNKDSNRKPF